MRLSEPNRQRFYQAVSRTVNNIAHSPHLSHEGSTPGTREIHVPRTQHKLGYRDQVEADNDLATDNRLERLARWFRATGHNRPLPFDGPARA